jgi:hypothetical protein
MICRSSQLLGPGAGPGALARVGAAAGVAISASASVRMLATRKQHRTNSALLTITIEVRLILGASSGCPGDGKNP